MEGAHYVCVQLQLFALNDAQVTTIVIAEASALIRWDESMDDVSSTDRKLLDYSRNECIAVYNVPKKWHAVLLRCHCVKYPLGL